MLKVKVAYEMLPAMLVILSYYWLWTLFQSTVELLLKKISKKIRANDFNDSNEKHNIESESQRRVVINKLQVKIKMAE